MKVSVKLGSVTHVFDDVDTLTFADFKAIVGAQFALEYEFLLKLGDSIIEGEASQRLADLGIVSGDRLFIVGADEPAAKRTAPSKIHVSSTTSKSSMASAEQPMETESMAAVGKSEEKRLVELDNEGIHAALMRANAQGFVDKTVVMLLWLLEKEGFQTQIAANWNALLTEEPHVLRFTCSHAKSARRPDVNVVAYDMNSSSPSMHLQASCLIGTQRPFTKGINLRATDFNQIKDIDTLKELEAVLYWAVINEMKIMTLGYGCALLDALSVEDVRLKIIGYLNERALGRLECTHSAAAQFSRSPIVDRHVWKRLLHKRFGDQAVAAAEKEGRGYRHELEKRKQQQKRGAASGPMVVPVALIHDDDDWRRRGPFAPPMLPRPYSPWNPLVPPMRPNPFDPFSGSLLMPNRPPNFTPGVPRIFPRGGGFPHNDPFGRDFI